MTGSGNPHGGLAAGLGLDAVLDVPPPVNEPVLGYAPGSPERARLQAELAALAADRQPLPLTIGGESRPGRGAPVDVVQPHCHAHVLGTLRQATREDAAQAVDAALAAGAGWSALPFEDRAAVFLRAAELAAGPWRARLNAATMLGQSKTVHQAEIDAACELVDFLRFNVAYARRILAEQPQSPSGVWNRLDYRPLEGFVYAVTPFNFTAIACNLPTAPALLGNVVCWKPAPTQTLAACTTMRLLEAAGLPPGVVNLLTGDGVAVSEVVLAHPALAGLHFTGSVATFQRLWQGIAEQLPAYRNYPRIVGETGGKDYVLAHPSAETDALRTALVRGAFEYQGQKCSAVSRAYLPRSVWRRLRADLLGEVEALPMGDVADLRMFLGAVIDRRAFDRLRRVLDRARATASIEVLAGGTCDDRVGYFVQPTVLLGTDPTDEMFATEYFGPILSVYVYDDGEYDRVVRQLATVSPYGLTGALFARDRQVIAETARELRYTAGNFYVNDKPTGSVVGQQPFGGARASGTNDKAGSMWNLIRWLSPRSVKETFVPPTDWRYPHLG